jgi:hypothetical protein
MQLPEKILRLCYLGFSMAFLLGFLFLSFTFKYIAMDQDVNRKIVDYLKSFNPKRIGIFGSYAREENTAKSDIDILVDFQGQVSLFDLGGIKYDLTEMLNRKVDIVTEKGLNKRIRHHVYKDLKIIFG